MFSIHTRCAGRIWNATITADFGFVCEENSAVREITWLSLSKNSVFDMFVVHHRTKSYVRVSEILVGRCVSATLSRVSIPQHFSLRILGISSCAHEREKPAISNSSYLKSVLEKLRKKKWTPGRRNRRNKATFWQVWTPPKSILCW